MNAARLPLWPRLICGVYEALFVLGVLVAAALHFVRLTQYALHPEYRTLYQGYLFVSVGGYFTWFWHRTGQTIPMRTWHLDLVNRCGTPPSWGQSIARYVLSVLGWITGISLLWALIDREGQFLHDRLLGLTLRRHSSQR